VDLRQHQRGALHRAGTGAAADRLQQGSGKEVIACAGRENAGRWKKGGETVKKELNQELEQILTKKWMLENKEDIAKIVQHLGDKGYTFQQAEKLLSDTIDILKIISKRRPI